MENGASLDVASRHAMIVALQEAAESLETPVDMLMRFCESVRIDDAPKTTRVVLISICRAVKQH